MKQRYYSLDVFRGATVCLMILVNNPGSSHVFAPLDHAPWHGLTPTDLVFPFFLFAVGNALSFVMPRLQAGGDGVFWKKVIIRTLLIYGIGLFLTWFPFVKWSDGHLVGKPWFYFEEKRDAHGVVTLIPQGVRILGVLARIAICYFFASVIIYYFKTRLAFLVGLLMLLLYWALAFSLGDPSDPYSITGFFGNRVDKAVLGLGHIYKGEGIPFDPEGIMSTMSAIVEVIFGYLVGDYIQKKSKIPENITDPAEAKNFGVYQMLTGLFVAGVAMIITGWCWDLVFPINKKIWTSSYTIYTSGLATVTIATMIYLLEIRNARGWLSRFFDVFGKNALFVFALSALIPKTLWLIRIPDGVNAAGNQAYTDPWRAYYKYVCAKIPGDPRIGSLAFAISFILLMWLICYWMDKKKIYVKV